MPPPAPGRIRARAQVLQEALGWIAKVAQEFGLAAMSVPTLLGWAKEDLGSPNAAVRTAATQLLAAMHRQLGAGLGDLVKPDVKPAQWAGLEEAFKANPQEKVRACVCVCSVPLRLCQFLFCSRKAMPWATLRRKCVGRTCAFGESWLRHVLVPS